MKAIAETIANGARRAYYSTAQMARIAWHTGHYAYGRRLMGPLTPPGAPPYAEEFSPLDRARLKSAFRNLFRRDWKNIEAGLYKLPLEIRRTPSPWALMRQSRDYLGDAARVARRKYVRGHSEVFDHAHRGKYPRYYLQNFHFQTDGWLSESSAERYDMQVETLFTGAAGAMRRQALPYIRDALGGRDPHGVRMLDVGCGTGVFAQTVLDNWPALDLTALDLSPAYLSKTRIALRRWRNVDFVAAPAEQTGLDEGSFDIVAAVYLFHELPPKVRRLVAAEIARLLKPGGRFILLDTIQYGDEPGLDILLENFPRGFHEPYYDSYCRTDLDRLFVEAGLEKREQSLAFLSKISVFERH